MLFHGADCNFHSLILIVWFNFWKMFTYIFIYVAISVHCFSPCLLKCVPQTSCMKYFSNWFHTASIFSRIIQFFSFSFYSVLSSEEKSFCTLKLCVGDSHPKLYKEAEDDASCKWTKTPLPFNKEDIPLMALPLHRITESKNHGIV